MKKNPGCPYFKNRATKPVNFVALVNPWLPVRKTDTMSPARLNHCHHKMQNVNESSLKDWNQDNSWLHTNSALNCMLCACEQTQESSWIETCHVAWIYLLHHKCKNPKREWKKSQKSKIKTPVKALAKDCNFFLENFSWTLTQSAYWICMLCVSKWPSLILILLKWNLPW